MNIRLAKRYADWVAEQVNSGRYASELEVVEHAIADKMAEDERDHFLERRRRAEEDTIQGRTVPASEAFFESKRRQIADRHS